MPIVLSGPRQQEAVTGRQQPSVLPDIVRASSSQAIANRRYAQEQRRLDLLRREQERRQRQETIATGIQGGQTLIEGYGLAKETGILDDIFGAGETTPVAGTEGVFTAETSPGAVALSEQGLGGAETVAAGGEVSATGGAAGSEGTAATTGAATGGTAAAGGAAPAGSTATTGVFGTTSVAGSVAGGVGAGVVGGIGGREVAGHSPPILNKIVAGPASLIPGTDEEEEERISGGLQGATLGAGGGFAVGGPVGAGVGFVIGGLVGSGVIDIGGCIIVTACCGRDSEEVQVARAYRDAKMTREQLRAYYYLSENFFVPRMESDEKYRFFIRQYLVDPLIAYGRFVVGMPMNAPPPSPEDTIVAQQFLNFLMALGNRMPPYTRQNGEVY